jgi:hypothetical protein
MPFEPFQAPRTPQGNQTQWGPTFQGPPSQPGKYGGPVDPMVPAKAVWGLWNLVAAIVGFVAGRNHYRNGESGVQAISLGVQAYARWMAWSVCLFIWGCCFLWSAAGGSPNPASDWACLVVCVAVWPFVFGVTWCRYVDYCLFRHGLWYRLFQPIDAACDKIQTPVLYLGMLLPLGALIIL